MKKLQILVGVIALLALSVSPISAQEWGIKFTRSANHITTKTTTTIVSSTVTLHSLVINVSGAGTAWTVTVQTKEGTPKILYSATAALGTTVVVALPVGIVMTSGIDIVTGGTTAGTMDVFYSYR